MYGVGGGAFTQLIADAPQDEVPVRMLVLATQPRDVHEIRAFDVTRRDDAVGVIHHAGCLRERRAERLDARIAIGLNPHRLRMRGAYRNAHRGCTHEEFGKAEHLARLFGNLALFAGIARSIERADLRNDVARERTRKGRGLRFVLPARDRAFAGEQFVESRAAGAAGRLVGRHAHAAQPGGVANRRKRRAQDDGGAVGDGEEPVFGRDIAGIDLGNDQRHTGAHAKRRTVVDDVGSMLDQRRCIGFACILAARKEDDVEIPQAFGRGRLDTVARARGKTSERIHRHLALFEDAQDRLADDAGRADDRNFKHRAPPASHARP